MGKIESAVLDVMGTDGEARGKREGRGRKPECGHRVHTDHLGIAQGQEKGSRWCCHAIRPRADARRLIWGKLEDVGYPHAEVKVTHIKAHRTQKDTEVVTAELKRHTAGNEAARHWAKVGTECDESQGRQQVLQACEEKLRKALDCVAEAQTWPEKLGQRPDRDPKGSKPQAKGQLVVGPAYPHRMSQRQARLALRSTRTVREEQAEG